jgi:lysyl-tRNA synthetase class 2
MPHLVKRAAIIAQIRQFFTTRAYLEVETPIMARYGVTDVYLTNIKAVFRNQPYCLQTSPEYHMKRLLAAGSGPIFQLGKVFRDDELGRWHNPEFTMLEWYQLEIDHHRLMEEVGALLQEILHCPPFIKKSYREIFLEICHIDPFIASISELQNTLAAHDLEGVVVDEEKDGYLFLLLSHVIEPALAKLPAPVALYGYPPSQAALARIEEGAAARFEFYYKGIELANGFYELTQKVAQESRFVEDLRIRQQKAWELPAMDLYLLDALEQGLPPCSGVALGVDRLVALALGVEDIASILSFTIHNA